MLIVIFFFFSSRRRHTRFSRDWSSDVCSSDLWSWIDPGPRTRMQALARTGRATIGMAIGLAVVLLVTGLIEAFVTPSGLPTAVRVGIGVLAEIAFFVYVWTLGRRAVRAGDYGDVDLADQEATEPVAA